MSGAALLKNLLVQPASLAVMLTVLVCGGSFVSSTLGAEARSESAQGDGETSEMEALSQQPSCGTRRGSVFSKRCAVVSLQTPSRSPLTGRIPTAIEHAERNGLGGPLRC
ncbi:MAG: hypothetical protein KDA37_00820 [Planctomycetales bacterium]|nr:hypothetical protein [Planctomycetales bacterium]